MAFGKHGFQVLFYSILIISIPIRVSYDQRFGCRPFSIVTDLAAAATAAVAVAASAAAAASVSGSLVRVCSTYLLYREDPYRRVRVFLLGGT